jgi:hypothetical protein
MIGEPTQQLADTIVRAVSIPRMIINHEPFSEPMRRRHALIVGGTHLIPLSLLFPSYAVEATVIIPSDVPILDREVEYERAAEFESTYADVCKGIGSARDLSGIDSDSVDYLFICSPYPYIRDAMLSDAWRVVRELGKVVIFTSAEIPPSYLMQFGVCSPTLYPVEGFYVGTMRKNAAIRAKN